MLLLIVHIVCAVCVCVLLLLKEKHDNGEDGTDEGDRCA